MFKAMRIPHPIIDLVGMMAMCGGMACAEVQVVAHPDAPCPPKITIVWTAAMQSAFDRCVGPKSPMTFETVIPENPLITRMRAFSWKEEAILPNGGWFAVAGVGRAELADQANEQWRVLSGADDKPFTYEGAGLVAYVGIKRDFQFKKEFIAAIASRLAWNGTQEQLRFFGVCDEASAGYSSSVRVLGYVPLARQFALQFLAKEGDDTLILCIPKPAQTMLEAMVSVRKSRVAWDARGDASPGVDDKFLHSMDDLRVPNVALKFEGDLTESFGGTLHYAESPLAWRIGKAMTRMQKGRGSLL